MRSRIKIRNVFPFRRMTRSKMLMVFFSMVSVTPGCQGPSGGKPDTGQPAASVLVLNDFEDPMALDSLQAPGSRSGEYVVHGRYSLELSDSAGRPLYLETDRFPADWSRYDFLKFDVYNPSEKLIYGTIQVFDRDGSDEEAEFHGQSYRGEKLFLNTGWNHFKFLLRHAMVEEGNRPLDLAGIRKLRLTFGAPRHPLYIDNIRLVAGEEAEVTRSKMDPRDCMTVIDNRNAFSTLTGPEEKIKTSAEITGLRDKARRAVEDLRNDVRVAELQGYQTLYERIPLITADVGLGIRSRLVWFQNEKEEKKILEEVIASCRRASGEIRDRISARPTGHPLIEPENEVGQASFYVPPLTPLDELTISDGAYRDGSGKPVLVFSMLQVNKGPLMDYFEPFNHRLESYTVGGGSRYNIENSPVYKAFHTYPGTHRVGWDGWCGHLIKDRWAMGGKKEDVVICLESPYIRKAVVDYMKLHYREWTENPNLLYNIMAYELQYICFCDESQKMFRDWLKNKYAGIGQVNAAWKTDYTSFGEIRAPETKNARPVDGTNRAEWYDWACFNTRRFTDYLKWVKQEMRKLDPETPICAGGTSSMLSSSNSVTGIDEEMIINEVDDVILNESGSSPIFSDLLLSLSDSKKVMVDPEMSGGAHGILLQFLHGKSDISKWWWAGAPSTEYPHMNESSLPHSKEDLPVGYRRSAATGSRYQAPWPRDRRFYKG